MHPTIGPAVLSGTSRSGRLLVGLAAAALIAGLPLSWAAAATTTTTFNVTATVSATCTIAANPLSFGAYTGAVNNGTTTITATCSNGSPYNVGLDAGTSTGATVTTRKMGTTPAGDLLSYGLFQNSGHTTNWGNTVGTDTVSGTGNGAAQNITVFGQIPAAQFVKTGSYSDTITATLTF
jgi:spore coat protein U-like protein